MMDRATMETSLLPQDPASIVNTLFEGRDCDTAGDRESRGRMQRNAMPSFAGVGNVGVEWVGGGCGSRPHIGRGRDVAKVLGRGSKWDTRACRTRK